MPLRLALSLSNWGQSTRPSNRSKALPEMSNRSMVFGKVLVVMFPWNILNARSRSVNDGRTERYKPDRSVNEQFRNNKTFNPRKCSGEGLVGREEPLRKSNAPRSVW